MVYTYKHRATRLKRTRAATPDWSLGAQAGHAVVGTAVAAAVPTCPKVDQLSIVARSGGALGFTYFPPAEEQVRRTPINTKQCTAIKRTNKADRWNQCSRCFL
eukprot:1182776-Prorocentrum_minimum.AAC.2